jgi:uncharacterized protein YlzI (FlbEa/FlbD family)
MKDTALFIDEISEFLEKNAQEINGKRYVLVEEIEKAIGVIIQPKIKEPERSENSEPTNY